MKQSFILFFLVLSIVSIATSQPRSIFSDSLTLVGANPTPKSFIVANKIRLVTSYRYVKDRSGVWAFKLYETFSYDTKGNIIRHVINSNNCETELCHFEYDDSLKITTMYIGGENIGTSKSITYKINDTLLATEIYKNDTLLFLGKEIYNHKKQLISVHNDNVKVSKKYSYRYSYNIDGSINSIQRKDSLGDFQDCYSYMYKTFHNKREVNTFLTWQGKKEINCISTYNSHNQCIKCEHYSNSNLSFTDKFDYNKDGSLFQATTKGNNSNRNKTQRYYYIKD